MNERATPIEGLQASDREFDNMRELLEALMTGLSPAQQRIRMRPDLGWAPATDVYETETEFVITMDIAGIASKDINVYTDGKILTIRGVRNEMAREDKRQFYKLEIQVGPFQRHIHIPMPVDATNIFTNYANGMLEVRLKRTFEPKRRIEVE